MAPFFCYVSVKDSSGSNIKDEMEADKYLTSYSYYKMVYSILIQYPVSINF